MIQGICGSLFDSQMPNVRKQCIRIATVATAVLTIMTSLLLGLYFTPTSAYIAAGVGGMATLGLSFASKKITCHSRQSQMPDSRMNELGSNTNPGQSIGKEKENEAVRIFFEVQGLGDDFLQDNPDPNAVHPVAGMDDEETALVERRMRPDMYSMVGFLDASQSLKACCEEDARVLEKRGITHRQLGDRLRTLMHKLLTVNEINYKHNIQLKTVVDGNWLVEVKEQTRGLQECPFDRESCTKGSSVYTVMNLRTHKKIDFSQLHAHLIRDHHFFEGNVSYRVDPESLCDVLELEKGVDYRPTYKTIKTWNLSSSERFWDESIVKVETEISTQANGSVTIEGVKFYYVQNAKEEAVHIFSADHKKLKSKLDLPQHFNGFRLDSEAIEKGHHKYLRRDKKFAVLSKNDLQC